MLQLSTTLAGLAAGAAYALIGLCLLLTYRLLGVVNFAQAAIGALGGFTMVVLWNRGITLPVAVLGGLCVGALVHMAVGFIMSRWFAEGTETVKSAVTVALLASFLALGDRLFGSQYVYTWPDPLGSRAFTVLGVGFTWLVPFVVGLAIGFALLATLVLSRTRLGLLLQAMATRPSTAELVGVGVPRLSLVVWGVTGALSAFAIMTIAPQFPTGYSNLSMMITWGFASALIGGFRSFWGTLAGGLLLGVLQGFLNSMQDLAQYRGVLPFLVIIIVLVWTRRHERWDTAT